MFRLTARPNYAEDPLELPRQCIDGLLNGSFNAYLPKDAPEYLEQRINLMNGTTLHFSPKDAGKLPPVFLRVSPGEYRRDLGVISGPILYVIGRRRDGKLYIATADEEIPLDDNRRFFIHGRDSGEGN